MMATDPECELCGGLDWVLDCDEQGREVRQRCSACATRRPVPGVPKRYEAASWANWEDVAEVRDLVDQIRAWRGGADLWCVLLHAESRSNLGAGKTRILVTLCRDWRDRGESAHYLPVDQLFGAERERMSGLREYGDVHTLEWAKRFPGLLALDDVGQEHDDKAGWAAGVLEELVDARYSAVLPLIAATNLDLDGLRVRYPRLWSRLHQGLLCPWIAPDFRRRPRSSAGPVHTTRQRGAGSRREEN